MTYGNTTRGLLLGTALTLPFGGIAFAQGFDIDESQLASKSEECRTLAESVRGMDASALDIPAEDIVTAVNDDAADQCATYREQVVAVEGDRTESDEVSQEVDLSEDATIEGKARVTVPEPNVDVQVPAPSVRVTSQQPQVTVSQDPAQIELDQAQPTITVEIPEIIVRVEIPAPNVYVLTSDPQISVSSGDPQVEVAQGDPVVSVTQGDPQLAVDLGVDPDGASEGGDAATDQVSTGSAEGTAQSVDGDVQTAEAEPQVEIVQAEGEPTVEYQSGDPTVSYEAAEPKVAVMMAETPTIEVSQTGEPTVTIETVEEREQRRQAAQQGADDAQPAEAMDATEQPAATEEAVDGTPPETDGQAVVAEDAEVAAPSTGTMMTVGELNAMNVITADGEDLGSPSGFIEINGETNVVLASGGFLGIGEKEVPVPMSRVAVQDGQLVLDRMTEQDIEAASDFAYDANLALADDQQVDIAGN